jgi:hypothetical protein
MEAFPSRLSMRFAHMERFAAEVSYQRHVPGQEIHGHVPVPQPTAHSRNGSNFKE